MSKAIEMAINMAAEFLPQRNEYERPASRIHGVLVFAYLKDGTLRVTVDTEDAATHLIRIDVNNGTVWEGRA